MKNFLTSVTTILFFLASSAQAHTPSEGNISVYTGPFLYKTNFENSNYKGKVPLHGGIGLVVLGDINTKSSLEIGMFFLKKDYFREQNSSFMAEQTNLTHITMGYRRWFNEIYSASLTFFSGYSMGVPEILYSDFPIGNAIDTSARDTTEYGFDFAVQAEIYKNETQTFVADFRYSKSVTAKNSENADHFGVMLGALFQLQEKKPSVKLQNK